MKAVVFTGKGIKVDDVPEPTIVDDGDALVAVKKASICASDLHLLSGKTPGMRVGGVIGHEFVGQIVQLGRAVSRHHEDTRVLGSFLIACGTCTPCQERRFNHCANRRALGLGELVGDLDGAQAEMVRIPNADVNLRTLSGGLAGLSDEEALFGGDVLATGFYAAAHAGIERDDFVVIVGAGPVGLLCAQAAARFNPKRVLLLDQDPKRVAFAQGLGLDAADVSTAAAEDVVRDATGGRMADVVIEAVGSTEAIKSSMFCARDGGRITIVGVYGKERYDLPIGVVWSRGLDLRFAGMANVQGFWEDALLSVAKGDLDTTRLITHRLSLDDAEEGYKLYESREATKVVLTPAPTGS